MTREKFDKILIEEGIKSKSLRDAAWNKRPTDDLIEEALRQACRKTILTILNDW